MKERGYLQKLNLYYGNTLELELHKLLKTY